MSNVTTITPNDCIRVGREALADSIIELAEMIRSGEISADKVILVYMDGWKTGYVARGEPTQKVVAVGMLEYAKGLVMEFIE